MATRRSKIAKSIAKHRVAWIVGGVAAAGAVGAVLLTRKSSSAATKSPAALAAGVLRQNLPAAVSTKPSTSPSKAPASSTEPPWWLPPPGSALTMVPGSYNQAWVITGAGSGTVPAYQSNGATSIDIWLPQDSIGLDGAGYAAPDGYTVEFDQYMGSNTPYNGPAAVLTRGNAGNADGYELHVTTNGQPASMDVNWLDGNGNSQTTTINFSGSTGT